LEVKIETDSNDAMEIKAEADSNDITECVRHDHSYAAVFGPSIGMFCLFSICTPQFIGLISDMMMNVHWFPWKTSVNSAAHFVKLLGSLQQITVNSTVDSTAS